MVTPKHGGYSRRKSDILGTMAIALTSGAGMLFGING